MDWAGDGGLIYNNFSYALLTSLRLGMWHGGELPNWSGRFNRIYTKKEIIDALKSNE